MLDRQAMARHPVMLQSLFHQEGADIELPLLRNEHILCYKDGLEEATISICLTKHH